MVSFTLYYLMLVTRLPLLWAVSPYPDGSVTA